MAPYVQGGSLSFLRSKRGVLLLCCTLLLVLFFVRPGASRLRNRIAASIGRAIGRRVEISSVTARLLPRPGFDLENFVVYDDPAFGVEPMLRSADVTASLRLLPLLRGHLEIARLSLTEPSLNFVRNPEGRWNLEALLERADHTAVAPTGKAAYEKRPGFPYIEASRGRINFKLGQEKTPYALTAADFSLWQDSEDSWGMRLQATPLRTDQNLSDTGLLAMDGTWQRASSLRDTPLQFRLQWARAQLGQVSTLIRGSDMGWRGEIVVNSTFTGKPAELKIDSEATIEDFRRYDTISPGKLNLAAHCISTYSSAEHTLSNLDCQAPVGQGAISLSGSVAHLSNSRVYDLALAVQDIPMQALVALASHVKKNIPADLAADGRLRAQIKIGQLEKNENATPVWQGIGETSGFVLRSNLTKTQLNIGRIPFVIGGDTGLRLKASRSPERNVNAAKFTDAMDIGPFTVALGRPLPVSVHAWASWSGYNLTLQGDAQLQPLLQAARTLSLPVRQPAADGAAKIDLRIAGDWSKFSNSQILGTAELAGVRAEVRGLDEPVTIASAKLSLAPDQVDVRDLNAQVAGTLWSGSLQLPRHCPVNEACIMRFDLHPDQIVVSELNHLLNPRMRKRPWYRFLSAAQVEAPYLLGVQARGTLHADRVLVRKLTASNAIANVEIKNGILHISDMRADFLGGEYRGDWDTDFTATPPLYQSKGRFNRVALDRLADLMHNAWVSGTASAIYQAQFSGLDAAELFSSATADLQLTVRNGALPHIMLTGESAPLHLRRFDGRFILHDGSFEVRDGTLQTADSTFQVSGTASLDSTLGLKLVQAGATRFNITGSLAQPHVIPTRMQDAQARLKP